MTTATRELVKVTLSNSFHRTSATIRLPKLMVRTLPDGSVDQVGVYAEIAHLAMDCDDSAMAARHRRVTKKLCGYTGCSCNVVDRRS